MDALNVGLVVLVLKVGGIVVAYLGVYVVVLVCVRKKRKRKL